MNVLFCKMKIMRMIFYRYEDNDGDGPFFTKYGKNRITGKICDDDTLNGCIDIDSLNNWFNKRNFNMINYKIRCYDGELLAKHEDGNCVFRKTTAIRIY